MNYTKDWKINNIKLRTAPKSRFLIELSGAVLGG
jgi:hypothetical protein